MKKPIKMKTTDIHPSLKDALEVVHNFIADITGQPPTQDEIADALKRYFVLNEIKDHIIMQRKNR